MATPVQVVFDARDPDRVARFWAALLGYELEPPPPGYNSWADWLREQGIPESDWNMASAIVDPDGRGPADLPATRSRGEAGEEQGPP